MTYTRTVSQRLSRPVRPDTTRHLYAIGQAVRLRDGFRSQPSVAGIYRITGILPSTGAFPQYRIRGDGECHERVATQDKLTLVNTSSGEKAALIERIFRHG